MVPRLATASSRVMPMPLSVMLSVPAAWIRVDADLRARDRSPAAPGSPMAAKRSRSLASEAFEMSSRRKISLWLYREWIMSFSSSRTSA